MTLPSPSPSSSSIRCLLVAMVTSPSVPPYGEAGRLEDILEERWWVGGLEVWGEKKGGRQIDRGGREKRGEIVSKIQRGQKSPSSWCGT